MHNDLILTNLTDEGRKTVKDNPERITQVNKTVEAWGVRIIAQYALLGPYDFVIIVEAEDNEAVLKGAMELGLRGTVNTITIPAIPIDQFIDRIRI